jgi:hypothetical protein
MVSRKAPTPDLSQILQFDPHIIFDPVPWPYIFQYLDKAAAQRAVQVQLNLHESILRARIDAVSQLNKALQGR